MLHDIEAALEARIQSLANEPEIAWWGRGVYEPIKGRPYLTADISGQQSRSMALGAKAPELWEGFLQIMVAHPRAEGAAVARQRADAVRDHFPRGLTLISNVAKVVVMERSIQPLMQAVDWLNYPVLINWICEEIHT